MTKGAFSPFCAFRGAHARPRKKFYQIEFLSMNTPAPSRKILGRSFFEWFSSLPTFCLLLATLLIGTGEMIHGQLLKIGESAFGDSAHGVQYFMLRGDPKLPTCNPNPDIDALVAQQVKEQQAASSATDEVDSLFSGEAVDANAIRQSVLANVSVCKQKHAFYQRVVSHITPRVKAYRTFEEGVAKIVEFGSQNQLALLMVMLAVAMIPASINFHHICIRPPVYRKDFRVQSVAMMAAFGLILYSSIRYYQISMAAGIPLDNVFMYYFWIFMGAILCGLEVVRLFRPDLSVMMRHAREGGSWGDALLSAPIFATMAILGGAYFLAHGNEAGLVIYINKVQDQVSIHLQLGLFIWTGMMLKQSRLADLVMNVLRPWKLSPEMLTYIILLVAALPTAYTGGSGIFVIAAGAIIYHEIRLVGGSRQFALAATAMSGSLGVVLRPCLLVVLITALNKEVTSEALYHWGFYVFLLTSSLFFVVAQFHRTQRVQIEKASVAMPLMLREMTALVPYVAVAAAVILFYDLVLDTPLNEITSANIVPIMLLLVLVFDKTLLRKSHLIHVKPAYAGYRQDRLEASIRAATSETVGHIGAFNTLIMLSFAIAGVVERSEVMNHAPSHFSSVWTAMAFLVVAKVLLGMFMDPFGAVVLVSGTLAPIAYANGINPVHFWMMVMVAFELGYLSPPVGLNHLLARLVVGEDEVKSSDDEVSRLPFFRRYERWILPLIVMSVALLIVAFGPLAVQQFAWLHPIEKLFI